MVDVIVARVVRRVDIYHLNAMEVGLLEALEDVEVVALDIEVVRVVEIEALVAAWAERGVDWGIGGEDCLSLVGPGELVAFVAPLDYLRGEELTEFIKVDNPLYPPPLTFLYIPLCTRERGWQSWRYFLARRRRCAY